MTLLYTYSSFQLLQGTEKQTKTPDGQAWWCTSLTLALGSRNGSISRSFKPAGLEKKKKGRREEEDEEERRRKKRKKRKKEM